jgi:hypothetical protein
MEELMGNKDLINRLRLINVFVNALINGIMGGIWTRYYNENLPYVYLQLQMFVIFGVEIIVSRLCENITNRKIIFNIHIILNIIAGIFDLSSIVIFQILHNPFILLIGDTATFLVFIIDDVAFVEIDSALLNGNERSVFSHKRGKVRSFGSAISYGISIIIGLVLIQSRSISPLLLTITQYINWVISLVLMVPLCKIYIYSKPLVYCMWAEDKK